MQSVATARKKKCIIYTPSCLHTYICTCFEYTSNVYKGVGRVLLVVMVVAV